MAHEFTRPFDLEAARAGAPYATRSGQEATILKWNSRHDSLPLVGIYGPLDIATSWTGGGRYRVGTCEHHPDDLLMTPLGFIEDKPVFTGDKLSSQFGYMGSFRALADHRQAAFDTVLARWPSGINPVASIGREARDMAIAEAVRAECLARFISRSTPAATSIAKINLMNVIKSVTS